MAFILRVGTGTSLTSQALENVSTALTPVRFIISVFAMRLRQIFFLFPLSFTGLTDFISLNAFNETMYINRRHL